MAKLKLQILLVPGQFSEIATEELDPYSVRKFLHLTEAISNLSTVSEELSLRYQKIYGESAPLIIDRLQDNNRCDLDYDFEVGEVFNSGEILRVVVRSPLGRSNLIESTPINGRTAHIVQSTPLLPPAPVLTRDANVSNHKVTQEYFERADPLIPTKRTRAEHDMKDEYLRNENRSYSSVHNERDRDSSRTHFKDDSYVSLPPPDSEPDQLIPEKKRTKRADDSALTGGTRITSGMLNIPLHTQLNRSDALVQSPHTELNRSSYSDSSSSSISSPSRSSVIVRRNSQSGLANQETSHVQVNGTQDNEYEEDIREKDSRETISKEEILKIFRDGVKNHNKRQTNEHTVGQDSGPIHKNALIKSLEIDMVDATPVASGRMQRAAATGGALRSSSSSQAHSNASNNKETTSSQNLVENLIEEQDKSNLPEDQPENKDNKAANPTSKALNHSASTEDKLHLILEKMKLIDSKLSSISSSREDLNVWIPNDPIIEGELFDPNLDLISNFNIHPTNGQLADYSDMHIEPSKITEFIDDTASNTQQSDNRMEEALQIASQHELEMKNAGPIANKSSESVAPVATPTKEAKNKSVKKPNKSTSKPSKEAKKITAAKAKPVADPKKAAEPKTGPKQTTSNQKKALAKSAKEPSQNDLISSNTGLQSDVDSGSSSNSDSETEANDSKQPRLVASVPSNKKKLPTKKADTKKAEVKPNKSKDSNSRGSDSKYDEKVGKSERSNSSSSHNSEGYHTPELNNENIKENNKATPKSSSHASNTTIRKPNLISLDYLASKGLPEVRDSVTSKPNNKKSAIKQQPVVESDGSSDSDSDDSSSNDSSDSAENSGDDSDKFISIKKLKKPPRRKKSNVFYSLIRDAKGS